MKTPAILALLATLTLAAPAWGQENVFGRAPSVAPLASFTGAVEPYVSSRGGGAYLAVHPDGAGQPARLLLQFTGRLGEPGVLRLAPHDGAGLAAVDVRVEPEAVLDLWLEVRTAYDADFAEAQAAYEAELARPCEPAAVRAGGPAPAMRTDTEGRTCPARAPDLPLCHDVPGYRAWIAEDGLQIRPSAGQLSRCGARRWEDVAAERLHAMARAALGDCVGGPDAWNSLLACLPGPEAGAR